MESLSSSPPPLADGPKQSSFGAADEPWRSRIGRAFSHRNYRLYFFGQFVSLIGTFLTAVSMVWLVYHLTGSPLLLGVAGFCGQIPMFLLAPFAGVWVDRWNKRRLLVITQILSMLQSFGLAAVAFMADAAHPNIEAAAIIALALVQGLVNAFDIPGRQAFLVEMVEDRKDLANAIALNSTMVHGARLIGPAMGGLLIHFVGPSLCFFIDGVSYIAVIAALLAMHVKPHVKPVGAKSVWHDLVEGLRYIRASLAISAILLLMATLSLTGMPGFAILMPIFAEFFGGKSRSDMLLGSFMASSALGALMGAIYLASRRSVLGLGRVMVMSSVGFGLAIIAFSQSRHVGMSMAIVPFAGLGMLISFAASNTLIQTLTEDRMRGRVMSFFTVAFIGMGPWGNLIAGASARAFGGGVVGASRTLLIAGLLVVAAGLLFGAALPGIRRAVRPIYMEKGIIAAPLKEGLAPAAGAVAAPEQA